MPVFPAVSDDIRRRTSRLTDVTVNKLWFVPFGSGTLRRSMQHMRNTSRRRMAERSLNRLPMSTSTFAVRIVFRRFIIVLTPGRRPSIPLGHELTVLQPEGMNDIVKNFFILNRCIYRLTRIWKHLSKHSDTYLTLHNASSPYFGINAIN